MSNRPGPAPGFAATHTLSLGIAPRLAPCNSTGANLFSAGGLFPAGGLIRLQRLIDGETVGMAGGTSGLPSDTAVTRYLSPFSLGPDSAVGR